jgi:hypothetical protein
VAARPSDDLSILTPEWTPLPRRYPPRHCRSIRPVQPRRRGHFPNDQAALKVLYLVIRTPRPNRAIVTGKTTGWKKALNTLAMYYGERITEN